MGKVLITLSPAQESWLRAEAKRQEMPGGMSELVRRIIDAVREKEIIPLSASVAAPHDRSSPPPPARSAGRMAYPRR